MLTYDKWSFNISDDANLKLAGSIKYNLNTWRIFKYE